MHTTKQHQNNTNPGLDAVEEARNLDGTVIWGTNIVLQSCVNAFRRFVDNFRLPGNNECDDDEPYYAKQLEVSGIENELIW
jgi:hypothetical protein